MVRRGIRAVLAVCLCVGTVGASLAGGSVLRADRTPIEAHERTNRPQARREERLVGTFQTHQPQPPFVQGQATLAGGTQDQIADDAGQHALPFAGRVDGAAVVVKARPH